MMIEKIKSVALAGAFVAASAVAASALTIDVTNSPDLSDYAGSSTSLQTGAAWVPTFEAAEVSGSVDGQYRSPFEGFAGGEDVDYFTVGSPSLDAPNPAILAFETTWSAFSLLWGSFDSYNTLAFYDANLDLIDFVTGSDILTAGGSPSGLEAVAVTISDIGAFQYVYFQSDGAAFEFSNVAAVPLPAGGVLLLTALGGLAIARRRKS